MNGDQKLTNLLENLREKMTDEQKKYFDKLDIEIFEDVEYSINRIKADINCNIQSIEAMKKNYETYKSELSELEEEFAYVLKRVVQKFFQIEDEKNEDQNKKK